jgi:hypothetical protein
VKLLNNAINKKLKYVLDFLLGFTLHIRRDVSRGEMIYPAALPSFIQIRMTPSNSSTLTNCCPRLVFCAEPGLQTQLSVISSLTKYGLFEELCFGFKWLKNIATHRLDIKLVGFSKKSHI